MSVTMWEIRAADGRAAELLDWVLRRTAAGSQVFQSVPAIDGPAGRASTAADDGPAGQPSTAGDAEPTGAADPTRVVVIDPTGTARQRLADPPAELIARPAHAWDFELIRNG